MAGWTTFLYVLLPHPDQSLILTQRVSAKTMLPNMACDARIWAGKTDVLKPLLETLTGAPVNIVRYVARHLDEEMYQSYIIFLLELRGEALPPNGFWQPLEKVLEDSGMPSVLHNGLIRWQQEQASGVIPERRAPWAIPGWHREAEHWIANQVSRLGRGPIQTIEPVKSWSISCVLKVTSAMGILYFKASRDLPLFVNEGTFLARLVGLYPDQAPVPVALAPEQGWMLLEDFGAPLGREASIDQQAQLMREFARLQIDSSQNIAALLEAGCKDRRLAALPSLIDPLFRDELVVSFLTDEEREKLKVEVPQLRAMVDELIALPIPAALLHGDLHAGNVVLRNNSFLYFDWTDAAISHPYFDMIHIFLEEDDVKRTALQETYLSVWEEHYSKADVHRAWALAGALYALYHAVSYQYIAHGIEELVQSELNFAYYFLRKLIESIERRDAN